MFPRHCVPVGNFMCVLEHLHFDCDLSHEVRWHHVGPQKALDFGTFEFQSFRLEMFNL